MYRRRLMGLVWMFLDLWRDDSTALNSSAPTKLGRIGFTVFRRSPRLSRLTRILLLISASHRSLVSSSASSSKAVGNGLPPLSKAAKSCVELRLKRLLRSPGAASSSSPFSSSTSSSPMPGILKWPLAAASRSLRRRLCPRYQCQTTTTTT